MLQMFPAGLIFLVTIALSILFGSIGSIPGESTSAGPLAEQPVYTVTATEQSYVGSDRCVTCHRNQSAAWSDTQHAKAYDNLPAQYRDDESCLKCHVTGLGETGGFKVGMTADEAEPFLSVGCESCHGPGAAHEEAVKKWTLADPSEEEELLAAIKTTIVRMPTESQCATCHVSQAHQQHPAYEGQPAPSRPAFHSGGRALAANVVLPPSPHSYSVKTCGSCHYEQYKQWGNGGHVDLSAQLPDSYQMDQECLKCHQPNLKPWDWYTAPTDGESAVHQVGVACESCHGSALKHVLYNKQNIAGPRLSPQLVEAARKTIRDNKPSDGCMHCHIREGHQEHPAYDQPGEAPK